ncbi:MAG: acetyltransferase [Chloroflexi bacterium]|nr:acetyltransferase [Chloroflexota bacterium]
MNASPDDVEVSNNEDAHRYEATVDGQLSVINYQRTDGQIVYTHTEVPEELEGHGIAARMAHAALEDARAQGLSVIPRCPFVASYIQRHTEYMDLVPAEYRARYLTRR